MVRRGYDMGKVSVQICCHQNSTPDRTLRISFTRTFPWDIAHEFEVLAISSQPEFANQRLLFTRYDNESVLFRVILKRL